MAKRIQKPKSGKVIRVSKSLAEYVNSQRHVGETWDTALRRFIGASPDSETPIQRRFMWTLPSRLLPTRAEATGIAIYEAAQSKLALEDRENPIKVYEA